MSTADLGVPGGIATLDDEGALASPIEDTFDEVTSTCTKNPTTTGFDLLPGGPSVTFDTLDGHPRLLILSAPGVKHSVGQTLYIGLTDDAAATAAKYQLEDALAGKWSAVHVTHRVPAGEASKTYQVFTYSPSAGVLDVLGDPAAPILLEVIRL